MMDAAQQSKTDVTACILCSRNCGLSVEIKDNQFVKIKGNPEHPFSQGYICQKAARLQHYQQHADRLTTPLKRQPDGSFQEVSWDVAIQEIADRLFVSLNTIKTSLPCAKGMVSILKLLAIIVISCFLWLAKTKHSFSSGLIL